MSGGEQKSIERARDHPIRVQILDLCADREYGLTALCGALNICTSIAHYHVLVLLDARLLKSGEEGLFVLER